MKAILAFHSIDHVPHPLSFPPEAFARLLAGLAAADLPVLELDALLDPAVPRGVSLTFDDGMANVAAAALPVLREHGAAAHLYLVTGAVGGTNRWPGQPEGAPTYDMLDWDEVEALVAAGVRIEAHTASHPDLRALSDARIAAEFEACDAEIARRTGRAPRHFAYPYGFLDARAERLAAARYATAATTRMGGLKGGERPSALPRIDSHYLRPGFVADDLSSARARAYLGFRAALRRARSRVWTKSHA